MKLLVIGAHHGTGALVVAEARARGHEVTAFVGDVLDGESVRAAVVDQDAVISLLGPREGSPPDLCSLGTRHIVDAMRAAGASRLLAVTGAMIGHPHEHLGLLYRAIETFIPHEVLDDRRRSEAIIQESGLRWTLVRPTRLTDGPATGTVRAGEDLRVGALAHVSRADVAAFLVDALEADAWVQRGVVLE